MSGGLFDYRDEALMSEMFGYINEGDPIPNIFEDREISELMYDLLHLTHDLDWYKSGDTGEGKYQKAKGAFKKKWLGTPRSTQIQKTIDAALREAKTELYKTYGIKEDKNQNEAR